MIKNYVMSSLQTGTLKLIVSHIVDCIAYLLDYSSVHCSIGFVHLKLAD